MKTLQLRQSLKSRVLLQMERFSAFEQVSRVMFNIYIYIYIHVYLYNIIHLFFRRNPFRYRVPHTISTEESYAV